MSVRADIKNSAKERTMRKEIKKLMQNSHKLNGFKGEFPGHLHPDTAKKLKHLAAHMYENLLTSEHTEFSYMFEYLAEQNYSELVRQTITVVTAGTDESKSVFKSQFPRAIQLTSKLAVEFWSNADDAEPDPVVDESAITFGKSFNHLKSTVAKAKRDAVDEDDLPPWDV